MNTPTQGKEVGLPQSWQPTPTSIICGRGRIALEHAGNRSLKNLVKSHLQSYSESKCKFQKSRIVSEIVETVHKANGSFVKFVDDGWVQVSDRHSREKVGQIFRDCLHTKYKSSTRSKAKLRKSKPSGDDSSQSYNSDGSSHASTENQPMTQASQPVHPLPECPPSMIRIESLSAPGGSTLDNMEKMGPVSLNQQAPHNPLNLSHFEPAPIDESTLDELFDLSFPSRSEPLPVASNTTGDQSYDMESLAYLLFDDCL